MNRSDVTQEISNNYKYLCAGIDTITSFVQNANIEAALNHARDIATFGWTHSCGIFVSKDFERVLADVSRLIPDITTRSGIASKRRVLTVMTSIHSIGGHSRIAWRYFQIDRYSHHTLFLTNQGQNPLPTQVQELVDSGILTVFILNESNWQDRIQKLRSAASTSDFIHLISHPNDILPCAALPGMRQCPPVLFMDHASHTFWLGATISHQVLSTSAILLESRRGIPKSHISWAPLPLDFKRLDSPSAINIRESLKIPSYSILLLSSGSDYKFQPISDLSLSNLLLPVMLKNPEVHLLVVGTNTHSWWKPLLDACPGRVHLNGYINELDLIACYKSCDIYLDPVPFPSPTAMIEAGACGKPIVRFAPDDWRDAEFTQDFPTIPTSLYIWPDEKTYRKDLNKLIGNISFRNWRGRFSRDLIRLYHSDDAFVAAIDTAFSRAVESGPIILRENPTQWRVTKIDELLHRYSNNQFRNNPS
jgi:glycosyltransferase involved in cell wall biosynthesis